jgi:adenosylmethionine-8-amino-7-oxononanoate aminotransferase
VDAAAEHPAIRGAEGCFLVQPEGLGEAEALAWADTVYGYNGEDGRAIIAARMAALDRTGAASELAAPERQLARRLSANRVGGG